MNGIKIETWSLKLVVLSFRSSKVRTRYGMKMEIIRKKTIFKIEDAFYIETAKYY